MSKHVHYHMIEAKAANMDLVVLGKNQSDNVWYKMNDQGSTDLGELMEYFLCIERHENECLHWLNGGEVERKVYGQWCDNTNLEHSEALEWSKYHAFMLETNDFRIKIN